MQRQTGLVYERLVFSRKLPKFTLCCHMTAARWGGGRTPQRSHETPRGGALSPVPHSCRPSAIAVIRDKHLVSCCFCFRSLVSRVTDGDAGHVTGAERQHGPRNGHPGSGAARERGAVRTTHPERLLGPHRERQVESFTSANGFHFH